MHRAQISQNGAWFQTGSATLGPVLSMPNNPGLRCRIPCATLLHSNARICFLNLLSLMIRGSQLDWKHF